MIPRALASVLLALLLGAATSATDLPSNWRSWRYSRSIEISDSSGPSKLSIPVNLYARLDDGFADLRIVDSLGTETPFILYDENVRAPIETRHATIRENSFVPGQYTQLVIDLGEKTAFHNALEINTSETDFIDWVEIDASDDASTWRIVKERAPISGFRKENIVGSRLVQYSDNNARFLRVHIFEIARQFPVSSVEVLFSREFREPLRTSIPSQFTPDPTAPPTLSRWTTDLGAGSFPVSGVALETPQAEFFRIVHMQTSDDGKDWEDYFSGEIYRYNQGSKTAESLRVCSHEGWRHRFWRIEVVNGNDAPLAGVKPTLLTISYLLLSPPQRGHAYRLIYGNPSAKLPRYDLSRTFNYHGEPGAKIATLGEEELTANYLDPRPYTERHPRLLWLALIIAVIVLAYAALRALRAPTTAAS